MKRIVAIGAAVLSVVASGAAAQPRPDDGYRHEIAAPAYTSGAGPVVCFDDGHNSYHRASGLYRPFVTLIEADGFRSVAVSDPLGRASLRGCALLVIVNPVAAGNVEDWAHPHHPAYGTAEVRAILEWTRDGGGLMLIVDHAPIPGAVAGLAELLGVHMFDGEARNDPSSPLPDVFQRADATLVAHPITDGRTASERVDRVATWTGHAFLASRRFDPLMRFGDRSRAWADISETVAGFAPADNPVFEVRGWLQAAARPLRDGRVVVLGEAGMCTALLRAGTPRGMNSDRAGDTAQFCLNAVRWLARVL